MMSREKCDDQTILMSLESKEYLKNDTENSDNIKQHIITFHKWFNEITRKCLLSCGTKEKNEYLFLLSQLKDQITYSIKTLGNSPSNKKQIFECGLCNEKIIIKPHQDIWECLQNHSHFDQLCLNFLNHRTSDIVDGAVQRESISNVTEKVNQLFKYLNENETVNLSTENMDTEKITEQRGLTASKNEVKGRAWYTENIFDEVASSSKNYKTSEVHEISTTKSISSEVVAEAFINFTGQNGNNNQHINDFCFNFETKYDPMVEQYLYPKFYQKFKIDGYFIVQRTGVNRTVCLTCGCELLMQRSTHNIFNHTSGQRHMSKLSNKTNIRALKNYHDIFYKLEPNLQAHQIYFVPDDEPAFLKCVLCKLYVKIHDTVAHIFNEPHKSKVMSLVYDVNVRYTFNLLEEQLEIYGIKSDVIKNIKDQQIILNENSPRHDPKNNRKKIMNGVKKDFEIRPHEIVKSIENPKDPNPLKTLPRRFAEHQKFLKACGSTIICLACKDDNTFSKNDIQLHLVQSSHLVATKITLSDYIYFCEICDMKFHDEMVWDLHFRKGPNKHKNMASSRKDQVCEHECLTCNVIIYGDTLSLRRHQNSFARKIEKKKEIVLSEEVKKYFNSKAAINDSGNRLLEDALNVLQNPSNMFKCCEDMENALSVHFKKCKAYPFGSRVSGLGNNDSDLDVFVDIGYMYDGLQKQDEQNQFEIINNALKMFRGNKEFYKITSRPTARTPIIKLKHRSTGLDCDISFRHGLSVENTKFLKFCFELQPISQKLILLLKKWSHLCVLNENITTYAFAMMSIFYFQTEQYLISVKTLKELNPKKNVIIDGWDTVAYTAPIASVKEHIRVYDGDVIELVKQFFKYYSEFDYKTKVICPLLGETILKTQFTEDIKGGLLPREMASYIKKINTDEAPEHFRALSEFCLQDPFDLSHNLTKACTPSIVEKFKKLCALSYEMLNKLED